MPYIDENTEYQFVKFKDGKEVFAMVRDTEDKVELHFPMNIQLGPAMTGGVVVHLGPYIPFTSENSIIVEASSIMFRTSISKKFIGFYDDACTAWLNIRDNNGIELKSGKQVFEEQKHMMDDLMRKRFADQDMDFRDELDQALDEFEEEKYVVTGPEDDGPGPDDTVH